MMSESPVWLHVTLPFLLIQVNHFRVVIKTDFFSTVVQLSYPLLSQSQLIFWRLSLLEYIKMYWVWEKPELSLCWLFLTGFLCRCPNFQDDLSLCRAGAASPCRMGVQAIHKSSLPPQQVMSWCPFRKDAETTARKSQLPVLSDINATRTPALFQSFKKMKYSNIWKCQYFFFFYCSSFFSSPYSYSEMAVLGEQGRDINRERWLINKSRFSWLSYEKTPNKGTDPPLRPPKLPQHNCDGKLLR